MQEALVETLGWSGMTHSAAMAAEILPGKTLLECLNTDLVCDAINVAAARSSPAGLMAAARPLSERRPAHRRQPGGPGQGPAQPGGHHVLHRPEGRALHGDGRRLAAIKMALNEEASRLAISSSRWARCWRISGTAFLPTRPTRTTLASTAVSTALPSTSTPEKNNSPHG